jgi:hypothetical protein
VQLCAASIQDAAYGENDREAYDAAAAAHAEMTIAVSGTLEMVGQQLRAR